MNLYYRRINYMNFSTWLAVAVAIVVPMIMFAFSNKK